jgi:hypothetical protein
LSADFSADFAAPASPLLAPTKRNVSCWFGPNPAVNRALEIMKLTGTPPVN